ncbi:MAG: lytic transglycosylase domain-containing protein [Blastocatellia bacterium]
MKQSLFFASSSEGVSTKRLVVKKLISTLITTAVMGAATLLFASFQKISPLHVTTQIDDEAVEQIAPRGLSRNRTDFDKALSILAEAAADDEYLADYYSRVAKRVKGEAVKPEKGSGVRVVKAARKIKPPSDSITDIAAASPDAQIPPPPEGLKEIAQTAMAVAPAPALPVPDGYVSPSTQAADAAQVRLTVGDMAYNMNSAIERWVNYYTVTQGGRRTMTIGIERSNSYLEMARAEFRRAGVPEDLVWLALVESVWNPKAVSPAAAGGIWQFIPKTATDYGLRVARGDDERADPMKQTRVAAAYLSDLHTIFGDWALAMAAYNSGEPRVMDAIVKNGRANFWDLYDKQLLPKETRDYVPKILAAIKVASQADLYGFTFDSESEITAGD